MVFEQLNLQIDEEEMKRKVQEIQNSERGFETVEPGDYEATFEGVLLKINSYGRPAASILFNILGKGNQRYYSNYLLDQPVGLYLYIRTLQDLCNLNPQFKGVELTFEGFEHLERTTKYLVDGLQSSTYHIRIGKNSKGYDTLNILKDHL